MSNDLEADSIDAIVNANAREPPTLEQLGVGSISLKVS